MIANRFAVVMGTAPYVAVGQGRQFAYGALCALERSGKRARERAEIALETAQRFSTNVRGPFTFVEQ